MDLLPSDNYFAQDSINNIFGQYTAHSGILIGKTLDDLCEGRCSITDIPAITVGKHDGKWKTFDNRRLWVFRHLERLGKCDEISVKVGTDIPAYKLTSGNGGTSVVVRGGQGGQWHSKPNVKEVLVDTPAGQPEGLGTYSAQTSSRYRPYRYSRFRPVDCYNCGEFGHIARDCDVDSDDSDDSDDYW